VISPRRDTDPPAAHPAAEVADVDAEIVEADMSKADALAITARIRALVGDCWSLIKQAYTRRAWAALGYESWDAYCLGELGEARLRIPREERPELVCSLRQAGMSIRAIGAATGLGYGTVRRELSGEPFGSPDEATDCGKVIDAMVRLLARTPGGRGVVLGVHHAGKDGKTLRGSSAFEGAADTVYFAGRDGGVITLEREKRKDGPEYDRHCLRLNVMPGTGSCFVDLGQPLGLTGKTADLSSTYSQYFDGTGCTPTQLRDVAEMPKTTFYRALSELVKSGELINTGTDKRPFYLRPGNE
jgi:hypothetical protein